MAAAGTKQRRQAQARLRWIPRRPINRCPLRPPSPPHGGDYVSTETNYYEIVYMPLQTRIYFYDDKLKPLSARDVHAEMTVQMPSENTPRQLPFQYVTMPPGRDRTGLRGGDDARHPALAKQGNQRNHRVQRAGGPPLSDGLVHAELLPLPPSAPYVARSWQTDADRSTAFSGSGCHPWPGFRWGARDRSRRCISATIPCISRGGSWVPTIHEAPRRFLPASAANSPSASFSISAKCSNRTNRDP